MILLREGIPYSLDQHIPIQISHTARAPYGYHVEIGAPSQKTVYFEVFYSIPLVNVTISVLVSVLHAKGLHYLIK